MAALVSEERPHVNVWVGQLEGVEFLQSLWMREREKKGESEGRREEESFNECDRLNTTHTKICM